MAARGAPQGEGSLSAVPVRRAGRVAELDGLRAVAVLVVVVYHAQMILVPSTRKVVPNGFLGVDLFFVLSGFLITALLLEERDARGKVGLGGFYRRRAIRLLPALIVLLGAHVVYTAIQGGAMRAERDAVLSIIFYYSNWRFVSCACGAGDLGHLWSLAVEEQFYMVWPFVLMGLLALAAALRRERAALAVLVVAIVGVVLLRIRLWENGEPGLFIYVRTDARADSLLVGALLAFLWVRGVVPRKGLSLAATAAVVVLVVIVVTPIQLDEPFFHLGGFTLVALACAVVILGVLESSWFARRGLRFGPLCAIGIVSYGLYLWHVPIFFAVADHGARWPGPARLLVALSLTAIATAASWFLVERPFLRWKARLDRSDSSRRGLGGETRPDPPRAATADV